MVDITCNHATLYKMHVIIETSIEIILLIAEVVIGFTDENYQIMEGERLEISILNAERLQANVTVSLLITDLVSHSKLEFLINY